jgi:hypothetical protein
MANLTDLLKKFIKNESKESGPLDLFYPINGRFLKDLENELKTYAQVAKIFRLLHNLTDLR